MSENIKTWPEKVKLFNCGHGFLEQYQNGDDETNVELYIRSDIVAEREEKLIEYAFDNGVSAVLEQIRYAEPPIFCPESDVDSAYYQSGLEKLK